MWLWYGCTDDLYLWCCMMCSGRWLLVCDGGRADDLYPVFGPPALLLPLQKGNYDLNNLPKRLKGLLIYPISCVLTFTRPLHFSVNLKTHQRTKKSWQVHRVGSSLIMKITLAYLVFTMVLYSLIVFGMMGPEFENVKESWFLIMLFTDIPKVNAFTERSVILSSDFFLA